MPSTVGGSDEIREINEILDRIHEQRFPLIKQERAIDALRDTVDSLDDEAASALRDEIASLTAELDQDWADWENLRDAYEAAKRARAQPQPEPKGTPEERMTAVLARVDAQIDASDDERWRRKLEAFKIEVHEQREDMRTPRASSTPAPVVMCACPRTAPRPRAARPRTISRASSRSGDSGDDSSSEPDLPALARLGRALRRALIASWFARVKDPGGDGPWPST